MPYFFSSLLTLSLLALGGAAIAGDGVDSEATNKYPAKFVQDYSQECIQTSMGEGLDEIEANKLCNCTINEFQRQYTLEEFKKLTAASATDETAETTLIEIGQVCFEQLLYEQ